MSTTLPRWSRSSPKLSPEIYDIIINNLHNSKADLITSSTVCKLWLSLSWYHLFGEVNYRPDFAKHLATSTHAMSAIAPYIRKVGLKGPVSGYGEMNILAESILCLPGLRELHIERASWDKLGENMTFPHPTSVDSAFHRITRIFFKSVRFSSFSTLSYFLDLFSALEELCLENVSWDDLGTASDGVVGAAKSKHSSLKKLRITFCHNRVVLNWLHYGVVSDTSQGPSTILNSRQYPRLRRLSLPDVLPGESDILGTFLAGLGESLENLEVGILVDSLDVRTTEDSLNSLTLLHNTHVKEISMHNICLFHFPFSPSGHQTSDGASPSLINSKSPYTWTTSFLSTAPLPSDIESVTFHVWLSAESQLDLFPWEGLIHVLVGIKATRVRFEISGIGRDIKMVEGWFHERLRNLNQSKTTLEFRFN